MAWSTDDLVADVKRRAALPQNGAQFSDSEILAICDEESDIQVVPDILRVRSEYFVDVYDQDIVVGTRSYTLPPEAVGEKLRDLLILDQNGNGIPVPQLNIEDVDMYGNNTAQPPTAYAVGFVVQGTDVILVPTPTQTGYTLRMRYYRALPRLVPVSSCAPTTGINTGSDYFTISPATPLTGLTSSNVDMVTSSGILKTLYRDFSVAPGSPGQLYYVMNPPSVVSDIENAYQDSAYIVPTGTTCFPQIPKEAQRYLAQCAATNILNYLGDKEAMAIAAAERGRLQESMQVILSPRVDGKRSVVIAKYSPLRNAARRWGPGGWW